MTEFEYENIFEELEIKDDTQTAYRDLMRKDVGDRVNVIDFSSLSHKNKTPLDAMDIETLDFNTYFLVIETNNKVLFKTENNEYVQDLVIVDMQTKKQYRIISGHVKLF